MTMNFKPGDFCWTELSTANVKGAKDFYGKAFGWTFTEIDMGDYTYTLIKINGNDCGGIWQIPKDLQKDMPPHWMTYIMVEKIEEAMEKVKKLGAKIIKPVTQVGEMGKLVILQDPTGAHIALWETAPM